MGKFYHIHRNENNRHVMKFSPLAALEIVKMTNFKATCDENLIKMIFFVLTPYITIHVGHRKFISPTGGKYVNKYKNNKCACFAKKKDTKFERVV